MTNEMNNAHPLAALELAEELRREAQDRGREGVSRPLEHAVTEWGGSTERANTLQATYSAHRREYARQTAEAGLGRPYADERHPVWPR